MKRIVLLIFVLLVFLGITAQNSGSGGSCNGVTAISEDFENVILDSLPECWGRINPKNAVAPKVDAPHPADGLNSKSVKFMGYRPQFLVLPKLNVPLSGLQLKFKINKDGKDCGILQVGYMSDPTDSTTFVPLENYDNGINYKEMFQRILYLNNVPDNGGANRYIAFRYGNVDSVIQKSYYYYWIDDVEVSPISSCPQPVSITVDNVTPTSIEISWSTLAGSATEWSVEYKELSDSTWNIISPNVTNTPQYNITGLTPVTPYQIRVRTICGASEQSEYTYFDKYVYSGCSEVPSVNETFENVSDKIPVCWSTITGNPDYPKVMEYSYNTTSVPLPKAIKFSGSSEQYLITPQMNAPLSTFQLKFKLNSDNQSNGIFQVGYMSDPSDAGTFVVLENYQPSEHDVFKPYTVILNNVPDNGGENRYIAFRYGDVGNTSQPTYYYYWLDDVEIMPAPNCLVVSELAVSSLTSSSADISFTANNGEQAWQYVVSDDMSITDPSALNPVDFTTNPFTITGLNPNTNYKLWVRSNCGSGNGFSEYASTTFTTECAAVAIGNSEWTENFAAYSNEAVPDCWTRTKAYTPNYASYSYPSISSNYEQSLRFGGNETQMIATPSFVEDVNTLEVEFDLLRTSTYSGQFEVGILSDPNDENSFVAIQDVSSLMTDDGVYQKFIISLASAPAGVHNIGFRQTTVSGDSYYVDNINVHLIPTCPKPLNLRAEGILGESATIKWTAGGTETAWAIEYKQESDTVWTSVANTNNRLYTIEGLLPQTTYEVRVKALCSPGIDESFWTEIITFRTLCTSETLPFTEDFSGVTSIPMDCWLHLRGLASDIFTGGSFSAATGSIFGNWKYDDNGKGLPTGKAKINIYSTSMTNTSAWLITPLLEVTEENINLEFDLALTKCNTADAPTQISSDDKFMVIVSTDGGATWAASNATVWAEDGTGDYVLSAIGNTATHISLNLFYSGNIKIAFYAESTAPGSDIDLHLDNINVSVLSVTPPTVTTQAADNITDESATLHKSVTAGSVTIISEGFRYKASTGTLWRNSTDGNLTGLSSGTTYDFFAYAIAGGSTYNGDTLQFTTAGQSSVHPVVTTLAATNVQQMSATLNKNVVSDPSEPVVTEGWKYKSSNDNTWLTTTDGSLTGLESNTEYKFFAFATTSFNTSGYTGDTLTFTTLAHIMPTVTTEEATNITYNTATISKSVSAGSEAIISEGWKYRVSGATLWVDVTDGNLSNLQPNTEYEFKAYASTATYPNVEGEILTFTTLEQPTGVDLAGYNVNIYPNPANEVVYIQVEGLVSEAEVTILDLQGKVLNRYNIDVNNNSLTLNVSNLADATYIVRIKSENIDMTKRLIIKK